MINDKKKSFRTKLLSFLLIYFAVMPTFGQVVLSYSNYLKASSDSHLISLVTEIKPSIYMKDNADIRLSSNTAAIVVNTDIASIPMLYADKTDYNKVELLKIRINSDTDEAVKLDLSRLTAFSALKYVLYVYQFNYCGDNKDTCLQATTESKVYTPADTMVKILYLLSIPE
ncbi:MAG TPA: hypothetical protein PKH58_10175 [Paludibacteraceae bacterium]|nr:hypothetical protein [Paludibacteraceae bacterium]